MPDPSPSHRVLLVEDEFIVRLTLAEALSNEGFDVIEASSGDEALVMLRADTAIVLLLTDIQLPGSLDGLGLARLAREARPELPTIFMTGRPEIMDGSAASARDTFIAKPYLPSEVTAAARRLTAAI